MKVKLTWKGSGDTVHPEIGLLEPNKTMDLDLPDDLLAALRADTSGLFQIGETPETPLPARRSRVASPSASAEEGLTDA